MIDATHVKNDLDLRKLIQDYVIKNEREPELLLISKKLAVEEGYLIPNPDIDITIPQYIYGIPYKLK